MNNTKYQRSIVAALELRSMNQDLITGAGTGRLPVKNKI
jgi:hypothetical protein